VRYKIRKIKIERQNETYTPKESEGKRFGFDRNRWRQSGGESLSEDL
jgi:hypothetical protein